MSAVYPSAVRRLGIYGGAFDPPHLAHEALARAAVMQYDLDALHILPTGHAWHKSRTLTASEHRTAMAKIAFSDLPQAVVDEREMQREGASYTIDTLHELQTENPQAQLFLLMGQDQLKFFPQWHKYQEILQVTTLLVALRADSIKEKARKDEINQGKIDYQPLQMPASPISATQIRLLCQQHRSIDHLVKPAVARYIVAHRLYSSV